MQANDEGLSAVELLIERAIDALAQGQALDLEVLAKGLTDADRPRFFGGARAHEYLVRAANGEAVSPAEFREHLASDEERRFFNEVLEDQRAAGEALPGVLLPGGVLDGRYEIRREIGSGGMGQVYAAFDRELEREVALKVLRLPVGSSLAKEWEELFRRESKTLAKLGSRNIVAVHDVRRGREHSYIVMDLVPGQDLLRIMNRVRELRTLHGAEEQSPEPLRTVVGRSRGGERTDLLGERSHQRCVARIVRMIALAVESAHSAEVVHRDLKPQNILLVPGGEPMLLDFGLASWRSAGEVAGFRGTPEYLAPEQVERQSSGNDPRTDVYQLGLVLYELLTMKRALPLKTGSDIVALFQRITAGAIPPARGLVARLSPSLEAILEKALERDPARRYQTARALAEDLERFLRRLPPLHASIAPARATLLRAAYVGRHPVTLVALALLVASFYALRAPPWSPPMKIEVFRFEGGKRDVLGPEKVIEVGQTTVLGLDVSVKQTTWLYVFSVFGPDTSEERQRIRPVAPMDLERLQRGEKPARFAPASLETGEHQLACTSLRKPDLYEGLRVVACAAEDAHLARLQERLYEREQTQGKPPTLVEARILEQELFAQTRGDPLDELTDEEVASIRGEAALAADPNTEANDWSRGYFVRNFLFEVHSSGH